MLQGKVNAALRLISEKGKGGVLPLSTEVQTMLREKHPHAEPPHSDMILTGCAPEFHPIRFAGITASSIRQSGLHTCGAAGPSGADAEQWRRMCISFKAASINICALTAIVPRLATEEVNPIGLDALMANRLIPLDKCPGLRPIGIGEVPRRIIGKTVIRYLQSDVQQASGPIQLCAGLEVGCEAAIHSLIQLFKQRSPMLFT
jgi:hypothetical protein